MRQMNTISKIWDILAPRQRRGAVALLGLMIVGMLFETLGVGLVIPALAVMAQDDVATRYPTLVSWLGTPSREKLIMLGMISLLVVFSLKTLFLIFLAWRQMRFVYGVQEELSLR